MDYNKASRETQKRDTVSFLVLLLCASSQLLTYLSFISLAVSLKVYWKSCPDLDTVGPTWYRLEPIHPTKDLGKFRIAERSKKYWSFLTKNDVG